MAGSTEHATPQNKERRHGEMVTFRKTDFTTFQKWINKFPCKARLKGWGEGSSGVLAISPRNRLRPDVPEISGVRDKHG